jgi:hypothetical protein
VISDPNANYVSPPHIKKRLAELDALATAPNWQPIQDHFAEDYGLEQEKRYWESRSDATASDAEIREAKLVPIQKRLDDLAAERVKMRGDDGTVATKTKKRPPAEKKESIQVRGARLLGMYNDEVKASGKHGALARVHARELDVNPKADRSNIGKQIRKARDALAKSKQGTAFFSSLVTRPTVETAAAAFYLSAPSISPD